MDMKTKSVADGKTGIRVAIYCRVSTEMQTVEPQELELMEFARNRGLEVAYKFSDVISGAKTSRAGLDEMLGLVRGKEIGAVLVVKIDRLARSLTHFAQLVDEFRKAGVALIATSQGIDTSNDNPAGRLTMNILGVIADFERSIISERTKAGLVAARGRGKVLGRPSEKLAGKDVAGIVAVWRKEGGGMNVRLLAEMLGGVSLSTAWRLAQKTERSQS